MLRFLIGIAALGLGGWFVASPYLTGLSLQMAVEESDQTRIESCLEKTALQKSLARQLQTRAALLRVSDPRRPLTQLIGGLSATRTPDQVAALLVTNEGLEALSSSRTALRGFGLQGARLEKQPRHDIGLRWQNLETFIATATTNARDPVQFVFKRRSLFSWKLADIILPAGP